MIRIRAFGKTGIVDNLGSIITINSEDFGGTHQGMSLTVESARELIEALKEVLE